MPDYQLSVPAQHPVITLVDINGDPADLSGYIPSNTFAGSGWYGLGQVTLSAVATSITFSAIPATYQHLKVIASLRTDRASNSTDNPLLTLNADTTDANYDRQRLSAAAASPTSSETLGAAGSRSLNTIPASTAAANHFGIHEILFPNYANTSTHKLVMAHSFSWAVRTTGGLVVGMVVIGWASTEAIGTITLTPSLGTNFVAGSTASLYGIKTGA